MASGAVATRGVCSDSDRMVGRAGLSALVESVATDVGKETNGSHGMGIGPGRPPGIVRERALRHFDKHIETLARIAADCHPLGTAGSLPGRIPLCHRCTGR